ncbi:C1 family peptidase [Henriciella litoralis]|uniref:C1 family peptidase n=1 Tax=Henriciella litoralis TaxID=568102 RepID=UPI00146C7BC9|nr:C1 family peptidase [Henriciella litoralis]
MSDHWNEQPLNGCLFETMPVEVPTLMTSHGSLPERIDLREFCSPVENQLTTNSCTANAIVGALEYHQRRAKQPQIDLSRLFVYYNARRLSETENQDVGSFIHHVMAAVLAYGACEERIWPFEMAMLKTRPTEAAYQNAMMHEAVQYARTPLGPIAMQALAAGLPVVFGAYFPSAYFDEAHRTGTMPQDAQRRERPASGHAMLIVGYDLPTKTWLVRNSWGEGYADKGYFRVPFDTMVSYSDPTHFWTIGAIEQTQGLSLSGPSVMGAQQKIQAQAKADMASVLAGKREDVRSELKSRLDEAKADFRSRLRSK